MIITTIISQSYHTLTVLAEGSGAHDVFIIYKRGKAQLTVRGNDEKTDEITEKPITDITVCNVGVGGNDETVRLSRMDEP